MIGILTFLVFFAIACTYALGAKAYTDSATEGDRFNGPRRIRTYHARYFLVIGGLLLSGLVVSLGQPYAVEKIG